MNSDISGEAASSSKGLILHPTMTVERTSTVLARLIRENTGETVEVRTIVEGLKDRSFGVLMILFAVPNAVITGISWILGAPIVLLALQFTFGRQTPWLPEFMLKQTLKQELFQSITIRVMHFLTKVERWLQPRWLWLSTRTAERILGLYLAFVAIILMAPIPFGNALPAFGIAFISAGLIEKDGIAIAIGMVLGFAGSIYIISVVGGLIYAGLKLLGLY